MLGPTDWDIVKLTAFVRFVLFYRSLYCYCNETTWKSQPEEEAYLSNLIYTCIIQPFLEVEELWPAIL